ncbi:MAG: glycosyltransferase family 1 protein, partial [Opitutus sp.]
PSKINAHPSASERVFVTIDPASMKIGLDVAQTCVERAGCAWHADALSRALIPAGLQRGHSFELYHHFGDWINDDTQRGTMVDHPNVTAPLRGMNAGDARKFWQQIETGEPLPGKPDVVLSFSYHAPKMPHTKLVYTVHDLVFWMYPEFATDLTRLLCQRELLQALSRASGFLFVSNYTRREFQLMLPGWLEATERPYALSPGASRFRPASAPRVWSPGSPWLMVGSLEPRKNHACALDAYELYHARSPQRRPLVFAGGRGWKSEALHDRIRAMADRGVPVTWLGYVPDDDLAKLYESSFALLAPSWHEGFGLPLAEAMNAGLPALASLRASLPEIGGDAARYIAPENPEGFAAAMLALEADRETYARRAAASLAQGLAYSWSATAKSVLEFVERL